MGVESSCEKRHLSLAMKGCLEEICAQPWAAEMKLSMGSKRIPAEWFADRLQWLTENKVPQKPDWNLSDSARNIADLLRWDYYNPLEDGENDNPEGLDLAGDLAEDLELEAENSLALRLHPTLRRQATRRAAEKGFQEHREKLRQKAKDWKLRQKLRAQLRRTFVKGIRERLSNTSRQEVLSGLVPETAGKPGAKAKAQLSKPGKVSKFLKPSAKKKNQKKGIKNKPSAKKKAAHKQAEKALADKALSKQKLKHSQKPESPPPLPPPAEKPEQAELLNQQVIVSSEAAGPLSFGRQGLASGFSQGKYHISSGTGTFKVSQEFVSLLSSKPKIATFCWPKWSQLSKAEVQAFLKNLFVWPEVAISGWTNSHEFVPVTEKTILLEDQQVWLGWQLLRWGLTKMGHPLPEDGPGGPCLSLPSQEVS